MERYLFLREEFEDWMGEAVCVPKQLDPQGSKELPRPIGEPIALLDAPRASIAKTTQASIPSDPQAIKHEMEVLQDKMDSLLYSYRKLQVEEECLTSRLAKRELNRHPAKFRGVAGYLKASAAIATHQVKRKMVS